jgi:transposase
MDRPFTPPMPDRLPGEEIHTKHKEAMRQLHRQAQFGPSTLATRYNVHRSSVIKVLKYNKPERAREGRTGRPRILTNEEVHGIIEYIGEGWEHRALDWTQVHTKLKLECSTKTLERRLKEHGYYRCVACQKPYLTRRQAAIRWIWSFKVLFWSWQWFTILWSDEATFMIGGKSVKQKMTRKAGERFHPDCIQHQRHRGQTQPVNVWGAIGYNYKSPLLFLKGSGKNGAFTQKDYLKQVLDPAIIVILEDFAHITQTEYKVKPIFMEDGNSAHGKKSILNPCEQYRQKNNIKTLQHPPISPDMNPIEKCWRAMKQSLHRRHKQPTNEANMQEALLEEWERLDQNWINGLIEGHHKWVAVLNRRKGWSTPN